MKGFFIFLAFLVFLTPLALASSSQAYRDYLYQFDVYRQMYSDFKVSKNEYLKFKTLTSQTTALEKTRLMMSQRDLLLRAYLLVLNEKLNENVGMSAVERTTYQTVINNEVKFLESHSKLIESIGTIEDAIEVGRQLESHYAVLIGSMRQTITGISLGNLAAIAKDFDITLADAKALVNTNRGIFPPEKQATIDRWLLQITNTRSLAQQKIDDVTRNNEQLRATAIADQDQTFNGITKAVSSARQYFLDGASYLGELVNIIKYE